MANLDQRTVVVRYPKGTALAALLVGACALAAQWMWDWHREYVPAQVVFVVLAGAVTETPAEVVDNLQKVFATRLGTARWTRFSTAETASPDA